MRFQGKVSNIILSFFKISSWYLNLLKFANVSEMNLFDIWNAFFLNFISTVVQYCSILAGNNLCERVFGFL